MPLARALRTFDFLPRGHHDTLIARLTIVANIFVDWHLHYVPLDLSPIICTKQLPSANRGQLESFELGRAGLVARDLLGYLRFCCRAVPVSIGVADGYGSDRRSGFFDVG